MKGERSKQFYLGCYLFRVYERETAIGYKKAKTNRNWVQILHLYHAKTVNTDMRRIHVPNTNLGRHERN